MEKGNQPDLFDAIDDERHRAVAMDLLAGLTVNEIAAKHGYSAMNVYRIRDRYGIVHEAHARARRGPKPSDTTSISPDHKRIGGHITHYMSKELHSLSSLAEAWGMQKAKLRNMQLGIHNFTLSDMQVLAEKLGYNHWKELSEVAGNSLVHSGPKAR